MTQVLVTIGPWVTHLTLVGLLVLAMPLVITEFLRTPFFSAPTRTRAARRTWDQTYRAIPFLTAAEMLLVMLHVACQIAFYQALAGESFFHQSDSAVLGAIRSALVTRRVFPMVVPVCFAIGVNYIAGRRRATLAEAA